MYVCVTLVQLMHGMLTTVRGNARALTDDIQQRFQRLHSVLQARYACLTCFISVSSDNDDSSNNKIIIIIIIITAGIWNCLAIELIQEIGRHITAITEDARETVFLFQCLSKCPRPFNRGMRSPSKTHVHQMSRRCSR